MPRAGARSLILGTAGHIDHGKSTLVQALTGVDPDRLPEEKRRGITIELGFAPLDLGAGLEVGVVDVPGHERLVRTMVAGASGIDLVLLVVAADEGVMPQTREHLAICELLGMRRGVVALTKTDRVDAEVVELASEEARDALQGTALESCALVAVSATQGTGLDELRSELRSAAEALDPTRPEGPPRLPVDRVFAMKGFGTVVTGTLAGAALAVGDAVVLEPGGREARVRGLQRFGQTAERVEPGARCAVNLQGLERAEISRGDVVTYPSSLPATLVFDAELRWLAEAPPAGADPTAVELLIGTAERRARVAPIGKPELVPGEQSFVRIHVDGDALPALPGDRFVLRGFASLRGGGSTLGGGRILDVAPPQRRRSDPALESELRQMQSADLATSLELRVQRSGFSGIETARLALELGVGEAAIAPALEPTASAARAGTRWFGRQALASLEAKLLAALREFHGREPLLPGMPRGALLGALPANAPTEAAEAALLGLADARQLVAEADLVRDIDHLPRLTQRQEAIAARLRADAMIDGLEPKAVREWCDELGAAEDELRDLLAHLERDGSLTRAGDLWFDRGAVDELRERVVAQLRLGPLETKAYKELIGTTRKYAVPLMELFDAEHLTVRRGEARVLRRAGGSEPK